MLSWPPRGCQLTMPRVVWLVWAAVVTASACRSGAGGGAKPGAGAEDAAAFATRAESELLDLAVESTRADWVRMTYITDDSEAVAARANRRSIEATIRLAKEAARFTGAGGKGAASPSTSAGQEHAAPSDSTA